MKSNCDLCKSSSTATTAKCLSDDDHHISSTTSTTGDDDVKRRRNSGVATDLSKYHHHHHHLQHQKQQQHQQPQAPQLPPQQHHLCASTFIPASPFNGFVDNYFSATAPSLMMDMVFAAHFLRGYYQPAGPLISHAPPPPQQQQPPPPPQQPLSPLKPSKSLSSGTSTDPGGGVHQVHQPLPTQSTGIIDHAALDPATAHDLHRAQPFRYIQQAYSRPIHPIHCTYPPPHPSYYPYGQHPQELCYPPTTYQPYYAQKMYANPYRRYDTYYQGSELYDPQSSSRLLAAPPPPPQTSGRPPAAPPLDQYSNHYAYSPYGSAGQPTCYGRGVQPAYLESPPPPLPPQPSQQQQGGQSPYHQTSCPCPMQSSCPKNGHIGPLIGSLSQLGKGPGSQQQQQQHQQQQLQQQQQPPELQAKIQCKTEDASPARDDCQVVVVQQAGKHASCPVPGSTYTVNTALEPEMSVSPARGSTGLSLPTTPISPTNPEFGIMGTAAAAAAASATVRKARIGKNSVRERQQMMTNVVVGSTGLIDSGHSIYAPEHQQHQQQQQQQQHRQNYDLMYNPALFPPPPSHYDGYDPLNMPAQYHTVNQLAAASTQSQIAEFIKVKREMPPIIKSEHHIVKQEAIGQDEYELQKVDSGVGGGGVIDDHKVTSTSVDHRPKEMIGDDRLDKSCSIDDVACEENDVITKPNSQFEVTNVTRAAEPVPTTTVSDDRSVVIMDSRTKAHSDRDDHENETSSELIEIDHDDDRVREEEDDDLQGTTAKTQSTSSSRLAPIMQLLCKTGSVSPGEKPEKRSNYKKLIKPAEPKPYLCTLQPPTKPGDKWRKKMNKRIGKGVLIKRRNLLSTKLGAMAGRRRIFLYKKKRSRTRRKGGPDGGGGGCIVIPKRPTSPQSCAETSEMPSSSVSPSLSSENELLLSDVNQDKNNNNTDKELNNNFIVAQEVACSEQEQQRQDLEAEVGKSNLDLTIDKVARGQDLIEAEAEKSQGRDQDVEDELKMDEVKDSEKDQEVELEEELIEEPSPPKRQKLTKTTKAAATTSTSTKDAKSKRKVACTEQSKCGSEEDTAPPPTNQKKSVKKSKVIANRKTAAVATAVLTKESTAPITSANVKDNNDCQAITEVVVAPAPPPTKNTNTVTNTLATTTITTTLPDTCDENDDSNAVKVVVVENDDEQPVEVKESAIEREPTVKGGPLAKQPKQQQPEEQEEPVVAVPIVEKPAKLRPGRKPKKGGSKLSNKKRKLQLKLTKSLEELSAAVSKRHMGTPRWSNGWSWLGNSFQGLIFLNSDDAPVMRTCYSAMRHVEGDIIRPRDCVLLRAGSKRNELPYVAKVAFLWENPEDGEMMMSLLWYYRPEHTEQGRLEGDGGDEVFASKHKDHNSVACIEDKCYVLTFNEYCRYRKVLKCIEENIDVPPSIVPPLRPEQDSGTATMLMPSSSTTGSSAFGSSQYSKVPLNTSPELVMFCYRVYEFRYKRMKNFY